MALGPRPNHEIDLHLQVVRADRDVDALALSPGPLDHPGHRRLGQAEEAEDPVVGPASRLQHPLDRHGLECPRPQPLELSRRPGQHDHDAGAHLEHEARSGAGQPQRLGAFRDRRLLANAGLELLVRAAKPLREPANDPADLALERRIEDELAAGNPGQRLHGPVVMSRPQPAGGHDKAGAERLPKRRLEPVRPVAHDEDSLGLDPACAQLAGQERPVLVRAPPADELAAGNEDDRSRMAQAGERTGMTRRAVITTAVVLPRPGTSTTRPFTLSRRFPGRPMTTCNRRCRTNRIVDPATSVPR